MEKDFAPYEESLALKELGFVEFCIGNYADDKKHTLFTDKGRRGKVDAPTFSQAFRWFREKYDIDIDIDVVFSKHDDGISLKNYKVLIPFPDELFINVGLFTTYEEAELACLKRLIEIANEK